MKMKYRDVEDVLEALNSGYMSVKVARTYSSNFRRKGNLKAVLVFVEAIERHLYKIWLEKQTEEDL